MQNTTVYIATHKLFLPPFSFLYKPITSVKTPLPFFHDQKGENISSKNSFYSELTILYWIWKNDQSSFVGLVHYHRYFAKEKLITKNEILEILKDYDFIVPSLSVFPCSIYEQYASVHYEKDLLLACEEIIRQHQNYKETIEAVLNGNQYYSCNMFISRKEILNEYASFLFPILFSLEEKIPYLKYSNYNQRVFGFLAERIFNIYLRKNKFSLYEYPIKETLSEKKLELKRMKILKDMDYDNQNGRL